MKRFRFPLRPVAVLRAHRESRARESFAAAVHCYVQCESELAATRQRVTRLAEALFSGRAGSFHAAEEAHHLCGYRREAAAEAEAERRTIAARDAMNRCRTEYLAAHRNLEVIRRLETKARRSHRTLANREEQAEYDDFASRRELNCPALASP